MAMICELCGEPAEALDHGCCPVCLARLAQAPVAAAAPLAAAPPISAAQPWNVATPVPAGGRLAIVTGGNSGIGFAITERLFDLGFDVHIIDLEISQTDALRRAAEARQRRFSFSQCDITDSDAMRRLVAELGREHGAIQVLVNNAGCFHAARIIEHSRTSWDRQFAVNVTAPFELCQAVIPWMPVKADARIVNIASVVGRIGGAFAAGYVASKHAIVGLTQSIALELAPLGINVNAIAPGLTDTRLVRQIAQEIAPLAAIGGPDRTLAQLLEQVPQHRLMQPREIADLAAFLVSPAATGITGQVINVSGGWLVT